MPRLLPRLLQQLDNQRFKAARNPINIASQGQQTRKRISRRRPLPAPPSFDPHGRTQSILLDPVNPILHASQYVQHKSLPPRVHVHRPRHRANKEGDREHDRPRAMTAEEKSWWSSPWLRMLSTPLRKCIMTSRSLPADFLIRLAPMQLPTPRLARQALSLLPDGLEHPKYKHRKAGFGYYVLCWKTAVEQLSEKGSYKRIYPNLSMHPLLSRHIGHVLRVRVLQELETLAEKLQARSQKAQDAPVCRKLTRAEFKSLRETGIVPYEGAVAILVVPPLNRDPITKAKPKPTFTSGLRDEDAAVHKNSFLPPPLSSLHPTNLEELLDDDIPRAQVPFYNGITLFPLRSQRAALHTGLSRLLSIERAARYREHGRSGSSDTVEELKDKWARGDEKASHAFVLSSDANTVKRADTVPLTVALWRVRMWEGGGWENPERGWVIDPLDEIR